MGEELAGPEVVGSQFFVFGAVKMFTNLFGREFPVLEAGNVHCHRETPFGGIVSAVWPEGGRLERETLSRAGTMALLPGVTRLAVFPDAHPSGERGCVGTSLESSLVFPGMAGNDIGCAVRAVVTDMGRIEFFRRMERGGAAAREAIVGGRRNIPLSKVAMDAFCEKDPSRAFGLLSGLPDQDFWVAGWESAAVEMLENRFMARSRPSSKWLPDHTERDVFRDASLGTTGRGNHFVEFCEVTEVVDTKAAWRAGVSKGTVVLLVHSGSREWGFFTANRFSELARERRGTGAKLPGGWESLSGADAESYVEACDTASLFAWLNRKCLERMALGPFGSCVERVVCDTPHNGVWRTGGGYVCRKGANLAEEGGFQVIAGSADAGSWLVSSGSCGDFLDSFSHGSGRESKGGGYKDLDTVVSSQERLGLVSKVARLVPLLTLKSQ